MTDSAPADQAATDRSSRRALLGAGVLGAAFAMASSVADSQVASAGASTTPLSDADLALAGFAISVELAARDLYQAAVDGGRSAEAWSIMRDQHSAYAQRLAGVSGISADTRNAAVYDLLAPAFAGDKPANASFDLENTAAATHGDVLAAVADTELAEVIASIAAMESRHAAYWAERSGRGENFDALFTNSATALTPEAL